MAIMSERNTSSSFRMSVNPFYSCAPCLWVLLKVDTLPSQVLFCVPSGLGLNEVQHLFTEEESIGEFSATSGTTPGVAVN